MPTTIVDCHSHIFNAEDLPIDGFVKRLSPVPSLLTGILSVPLDRLTAWVAPGHAEAEDLLARLAPTTDLEGVESLPAPVESPELVSDEELDQLLVSRWPPGTAVPPAGMEGVESTTDDLARRIELASWDQLRDLEAWLVEWGDPEFDEVVAAERSAQEGLTDWVARANTVRKAARRYVQALRLISRHRYLIAADLAGTYPEVSLFVPALVDFSHTTHDDPATSIPRQIAVHSLVSKLSVAAKIPGAPDVRFHPMVGFCPYREVQASELKFWDIDAGTPNDYVPYAAPRTATDEDRYRPGIRFDVARAKALRQPTGPWHAARLQIDDLTRALDLVRHAVELGGFVGVKLYPPAGFAPIGNVARFGEARGQRLDAALRALYGYCEPMAVPILTHASHSNGFEDGYDDLAAPTAWEQVLAEYPNLRLCFGHFGHLHGVGPDSAHPSPSSWSRRFLDLVDRYPNVYADVGNSKFALSDGYRSRYLPLLRALLGPDGTVDAAFIKRRRRLMFGSDYWMNTLSPDHAGYLDVFRDEVGSHFADPELLDWFMGLNALRFLGLTGEDDQPDTASASYRRLVAFYDANPPPPWLTAPA